MSISIETVTMEGLLTAAEALTLPSVQPAEPCRKTARELLSKINSAMHGDPGMKLSGLEMKTTCTDGVAMMLVILDLQSRDFVVQCQPQLDQPLFPGAPPRHKGYALQIVPSPSALAAWRSANPL